MYELMPLKPLWCRLLKALPLPHAKFYSDLKFRGPFTVNVSDRAFRMIHTGGTIENEIFWNGLDHGWERVSTGLWVKLCASAKAIVDVGANSGVYSLVAAKVNPEARVLAFEPSAAVFAVLLQNIRINSLTTIKAFPSALSNHDGHAVLYDFNDPTLCSSSLNVAMFDSTISRREIEVSVRTLDAVLSEENLANVDLVKIDVEMHEAEVLDGFARYLNRNRPSMLIEVLTDEIGMQIERRVQGLDYLYFDIDEAGSPQMRNSIKKSRKYNYLLCQPAVASKLGLPAS